MAQDRVASLHGVFIQIFGVGVLLAGPAGVGKSELALELLGRGHRLIADDAAEFHLNASKQLIGVCPALLSGFIEVRGLGVLNARRMFGEDAVAERARLDLILFLEPSADAQPLDRLHGRRGQQSVLGVGVPQLRLPVRVGHNLAAVAEAACRDQKLRAGGYDAAEDLIARQMQQIESQP